jgi:micrococcal nuclease
MTRTTRFRVVLLVVLLLLAGCSAGPDSTPGATTPAPESTSIPKGPQQGTEGTVTITRIIYGDTVEARFPNGEIDTLRLLGVDTPETTLSRVSPEEFEGIPDTTAGRDHLFNWGEMATEYASDELENRTVRIEIDPDSERRGSFGRLLVYIYVGGTNFNKQLLTDGYARMYDSSFSKREEFSSAEATARENRVGVWGFEEFTATPPVTSTNGNQDASLSVARIHADAAGNDHENENDEYVIFENTGDGSLDLAGWTVSDEAGHTYSFPDGFVLPAGEQVTLYTGSGTSTDTEQYWGSDSAIWNNGGDVITVKDETGDVVLEEAY